MAAAVDAVEGRVDCKLRADPNAFPTTARTWALVDGLFGANHSVRCNVGDNGTSP